MHQLYYEPPLEFLDSCAIQLFNQDFLQITDILVFLPLALVLDKFIRP